MLRRLMVLVIVSICSCYVFAQSDQQALAYAAQSLAAMTGGTEITDVTLTGNATWTLGDNQDQGPATFLALGTGESKVDLMLSQGERTEIRDAATGTLLGEWILRGGDPTPFAWHNCWTDAAWFFPALTSMTIAPNGNVVLKYLGEQNWQGLTVQHLQAYYYSPRGDGHYQAMVQSLSTVDYYLDATTLLPVATTMFTHPDDDSGTLIPIQILFLSYQSINGAQVPSHIQKYFNGVLLLDFSVDSVALNSGLPLSDFTIQ